MTEAAAPTARFNPTARAFLAGLPAWARSLGYAEVAPPLLLVAAWQRARDVPMFLFDRLGLDLRGFVAGGQRKEGHSCEDNALFHDYSCLKLITDS